eukprot:2920757-Prymnesium_polylepis.1
MKPASTRAYEARFDARVRSVDRARSYKIVSPRSEVIHVREKPNGPSIGTRPRGRTPAAAPQRTAPPPRLPPSRVPAAAAPCTRR